MDQIPDDPAAGVYRLPAKQDLQIGQHLRHLQDARGCVSLKHRDMPRESQQSANLAPLAMVINHPTVTTITIL
jgi:hypothetical protein